MNISNLFVMLELWVKTDDDFNLKTYIHNPAKNLTAFIFCHGFPACSNSSFYQRMSEIISKDSLVCRFDFRGQGKSDGTFFNSSITHKIEDLDNIIKYVKNNYHPKKVVILAHSFGAIIAMLQIVQECSTKSEGLVGEGDLAKAIHLEFNDDQIQELEEKGETRIFNWSTRQKELISEQFLGEMRKYSSLEAAKKITIPVLFFHGTKDESIPVGATEEMYSLVNGEKAMHLITGASHTYNSFMDPSLIGKISITILNWIKTI